MHAGIRTLAFDVYGTLIDTDGVLQMLRAYVGEKAEVVMNTWRAKQLEYTFRRGLMRRYVDFSVCTRQALDFACRASDIFLTEAQTEKVIRDYDTLPAYPDAMRGLASLDRVPDLRKFAFSNGRMADVERVLKNSGLIGFFDGIISVDAVRSFKPDPAVYKHLLAETKSSADRVWLISGNSFDVIGAKSADFKAIWLRRSAANIFDSWEFQPDAVISSVEEIGEVVSRPESSSTESSSAKSGNW